MADDWVDGVLVVGRTSGSYGAAAAGGMDVFVQKAASQTCPQREAPGVPPGVCAGELNNNH